MDTRETTETRETRETRKTRKTRETRENGESKESRESRETRKTRETMARETRETGKPGKPGKPGKLGKPGQPGNQKARSSLACTWMLNEYIYVCFQYNIWYWQYSIFYTDNCRTNFIATELVWKELCIYMYIPILFKTFLKNG